MAKFKCNVPFVVGHSFMYKKSKLKFETPIINTEDKGLIKFLEVNRNYDIINAPKPKAK